MIILDREIERIISNSRNRSIGYNMFQNNEVLELYVTFNEAYKSYVIRAKVGIDPMHLCYIELNTNNKIVNFECNCYFCDAYSGCSHHAAMLYKLQVLNPKEFPFHYKSDNSTLEYKSNVVNNHIVNNPRESHNRDQEAKSIILKKQQSLAFINEFVHLVDAGLRPSEKHDMETVFAFDGRSLTIRYRVGGKQKYVIKDLTHFLSSIDNKLEVNYGKNLKFVHQIEAFSEDAKTHIEFMKNVQTLPHKERTEDDLVKYINLKYATIDRFFDVYCMDFALSELKFEEIVSKPQIIFTEKEDHYVVDYKLTNDFDNLIFGLKHLYHFHKGVLTRIVFDEEGKTIRLLEKLIESPLYVSKDDVMKLYRFVLWGIRDFIDITGLKGIEDAGVEHTRNFYGEIDEDGDVAFWITCDFDEGTYDSADVSIFQQSTILERMLTVLDEFSDYRKEHRYCIAQSNPRLENFLYEVLPIFSRQCKVYMSDDLKATAQQNNLKVNVGISIKQDLLQINLSSIDIPSNEIISVLNSYRRKRKFHKMSTGDLLTLHEDELRDLDDLLIRYGIEDDQIVDGQVTLPMYRAFAMNYESKNESQLSFDRSHKFKEVIDNLKTENVTQIELNEVFDNTLRDYQKVGVNWLHTMKSYGFGGILADDMGLGKTLQVITLLESGATKKSIIVAPASLILNWEDEFIKFGQRLSSVVVHGGVQYRKNLISKLDYVDVVITSYDYLKRDIEHYQNIEFEYIILDEAQYIKNPKTISAQVVKKLNGQYRFALTGTPIENSLAELWSIFDFLMKDYLYSYRYFQKNFEIPVVRDKDKVKQMELKSLIEPFILRRTKKDVLKELPDKIEKTITVEFTDEENKLYIGNLAQVNKDLQSQLEMENLNKIEILAMLTRLRQICCEPRIVYENIEEVSSKMSATLDLIDMLKENNKKVLLFSSFTSTLELLQEELTKRSISYYVLTGDVAKTKRKELVDKFQNDDTTIFLISLKAGGTGLNLTAAEAVIHFDPWWNVSAQNQATDRAHRMGQENTVEVYKFIMKNSIEEKIALLQEQKKDLADMFIEGNEGSISSMSTTDILELFKM